VLTDESLCLMACELIDTVKRNVSIDWTQKESVKAILGKPPQKGV
jgi:hypothetical protein